MPFDSFFRLQLKREKYNQGEMGLDSSEIGVQIRKLSIISVRTCYRSVCDHPFLVGFLCFMFFLYRSFPFLFSLLISASPVFVCTAILLGTLLIFGKPNIPEIEKEEEKISHDIASLKTRVSEDSIVVEKDNKNFDVERFVERKEVVDEKVREETSSGKSDVEENIGLVDNIDGNSREIHLQKRVMEEKEREFNDPELEKAREIHEENLGVEGLPSNVELIENYYSLAKDAENQNLQLENDKLHSGDRLDSEDDDEEEDSGSESDGAESSSPDASMADIIPMLDELHPLLDSGGLQPDHMSHDGSDATSEQSHKDNDGSVESDSDEDMEKHGDEEDGDDDNDGEEEQAAQEAKHVRSKSVISWTEDDQKNLMDLGTLELERNQRLESLIARRRARQNMKLMAEKNLIDLDSSDLPFNIPSIATTRRNPFDVPYDSYDSMGLPPIPGSAPSILLPRRNPFDLPYEPNEEKPDLKGDSFQQEFIGFHQKDAFFRRHESFSLGPSVLGGQRQDKWRPYFVPERLEGTSYGPFQRQSSEVSDSKLSSVPDTDSVSSAADEDDKKLSEQKLSQEAELISNLDHASDRVEDEIESSEVLDSEEMEQEEESDGEHDEVEITLGDSENQQEMELSWSETRGEAAHMEVGSTEIHLQREVVEEEYSSRSSSSSVAEVDEKMPDLRREEGSTSSEPRDDLIEESNQHKDPVYDSSPPKAEKHLSFSSTSSDLQAEISEIGSPPMPTENTDLFADKEFERQSANIEKDAPCHEQMCESSAHLSIVDENESRPREVAEIGEHEVVKVGHVSANSSSLSSDIVSVEEGNIPDEEDQVHSSNFDVKNDVEVPQDVVEQLDSMISSHQMPSRDLTLVAAPEEQQPSMVVAHILGDNLSHPNTKTVEEYTIDEDQAHSSSSSDNESAKETTKNESFQHKGDQIHKSSSSDAEIRVVDNQDADEKLDPEASSYQHTPSTAFKLNAPEEQQPALVAEEVTMALPNLSSLQTEHVEEHSSNGEETLQFEQNQLHPSTSDLKMSNGVEQDLDVKVVSSSSGHQHVLSEENSPPQLQMQLSWKDKSMVEPSFGNYVQPEEPSIIPTEYTEEARITNNVNEVEGQYSEDKSSPKPPSLTHDSTLTLPENSEFKQSSSGVDLTDSILAGNANEGRGQILEHLDSTEAYGSHSAQETANEEADEIKEIDEGLLSELDTIGDFSVKEVVGDSFHTGLDPEETKVKSTESEVLQKDSTQTEVNSELPVLEARSFDDIDLAFKQLHKGVDVEEVILPSAAGDQLVGPNDRVETNSDLQVIEARSLDDLHMGLKQVWKGDMGKLPELLDSKNGSAGIVTNGVGSTKEIESSSNVESGIEETNKKADNNQKHGFDETSDAKGEKIS